MADMVETRENIVNCITSLSNPKIKNVVKLRQRKERQQQGVTIVEGIREIERAVESKVVFQEVYVDQDCKLKLQDVLEKLFDDTALIYEVPKAVFAKISYGDRRDGLLAVGRMPDQPLSQWKRKKQALYVVLERVEKPGNLGAILRTCDGVGVDGVIVCDPKTDIYNPNVIRASLGAVFSVNVAAADQSTALAFLQERHAAICAATPDAKTVYTQADLSQSLAVALGSEQQGLSDFWIKQADTQVRIPMRGKTDSLNVSVSAAVILYEVLKQRMVYEK